MEKRIFEIINIVLKNRGKKLIKELKPKSHLRYDIGLDSLDLAELTVRIEAEYDIDIFEDSMINTVGEIFDKLNSK